MAGAVLDASVPAAARLHAPEPRTQPSPGTKPTHTKMHQLESNPRTGAVLVARFALITHHTFLSWNFADAGETSKLVCIDP